MRVARAVLDCLSEHGVRYIVGIPAGSVNAIFDELYDLPKIQPIVVKHEGAAGYMAAAYAKATGGLAVCIGSSGPGATNLVTGAANALREQLPVLFITGHVPVSTQGLNASQELRVDPVFSPITKSSVTVQSTAQVMPAIVEAIALALSGVPGPVHVAIPIDIQLAECPQPPVPESLKACVRTPGTAATAKSLDDAVEVLGQARHGVIFIGQGARDALDEVLEIASRLAWPILCSAQAKGLLPTSTPGFLGVFGFAGDERCVAFMREHTDGAILIVGSSLGETATNNYNPCLTGSRQVVQIDRDETVFGRKYPCHVPVCEDAATSLRTILQGLTKRFPVAEAIPGETANRHEPLGIEMTAPASAPSGEHGPDRYDTQRVLLRLQSLLPRDTRYTVDIGEFMSYVIHHMQVYTRDSFEINVHFGPMGVGIASAIGWKLADQDRPVVSITGDGCFFMHGMELLTAKEHNLSVIWVVFNNARLGMVHQGHRLQYGRSHACFTQAPVNIAKMATAMGIRSARVEAIADLDGTLLETWLATPGPAVLEIALVDESIPPMGDRVKFLSSFGHE